MAMHQDSWDGGGGLNFGGTADSSGNYTIDHNIFIGNSTSYFGGGLWGGSDLGITYIHNNLILNNYAEIKSTGRQPLPAMAQRISPTILFAETAQKIPVGDLDFGRVR